MDKTPLVSVTKKDLDITYFSGTGKGGQHRNKHQNCVRIQHKPSGVLVTASNSRSKETNLKDAFLRLTEDKKFQNWIKIESSKMMGLFDDIEKEVEEQMKPKNLKVEVKENGKWVDENKSECL